MEKVKIDKNALVYPLSLVGAVVNGKAKFMAVGWIARVNFKPPIIGIALGPHYTNRGIEEHGGFSVNIPWRAMIEKTDGNIDKSKVLKYFTVPCRVRR